MSEVTVTGLDELRSTLNRIATEFPARAGEILRQRTEVEVRSREKVSGWRKPLDIVLTDDTSVAVAWPYEHQDGVGTYVSRITDEAGRLLPEGLGRDLGAELERYGR